MAEKIPQHPLVQALVPDPKQPPQPTVKLVGLPGTSPDASATRLWLDHDLSSYVDVPSSAVLYNKTLPEDGGSVLWVSADAKLNYGSVGSHTAQGSYLGGSIVQQNLAGAAGYGAPAYTQAPYGTPSVHVICPTPTATPSVYVPCVTHTPPCPTPGTVMSVPIFLCPPTHVPPCGLVTHLPPCGPPITHVPPCGNATYAPPCGPATLVPPCGPVTYDAQCTPHVTSNPPCPVVQATYDPACVHPVPVTYDPQCAPVHVTYYPHCAPTAPATIGPPCMPVASTPVLCPITHRPPVCPPIVSGPPCTLSHVGCPAPVTHTVPVCRLPISRPPCTFTHLGCPPPVTLDCPPA
jgi:hypothetical protein